MMKNEEFYARAQEVRDDYGERKLPLYQSIVCDILVEIFKNGDKFPSELIFAGHHYTKDIVEDVLYNLKVEYSSISQLGDYFLIKNPTFK